MGADHLYDFLNALPKENLLAVKQSLGLLGEGDRIDKMKAKSQDVPDVQAQAVSLSKNLVHYPAGNPAAVNYHDMVTWLACEAGVNKTLISRGSTFVVEMEIQKQLFAQLWDKLPDEYRREILAGIDPTGLLKNHAGVALLSGAGVIGALSTTTLLTGFTFYTTMSVAISMTARYFGVKLPFTAASSLITFLGGPVGWAIMSIATNVRLALAGEASVKKTSAFVLQIHSLKVAALLAAENDIFKK